MLNQAQLIGRLGKDPELRVTQAGLSVATLTLATTEKWKDSKTGETKEATEWHRVTLYSKLAEIAEKYLVKGSLVFIQGKIQTRKYTDKQGVDKYSTEIHGLELKLLGGKAESHGAGKPALNTGAGVGGGNTITPSKIANIDDDLPF